MSNSDVLTAGLMLFGMEEPNEFVRIGHLERINHGTLILGSITELSPDGPQRLNTRLLAFFPGSEALPGSHATCGLSH